MRAWKPWIVLSVSWCALVAMLVGCGVNNSPKPVASASTTTSSGGGGGGGGGGVSSGRTILDSGRTNIFDITQDATRVYWTEKLPGVNGVVRRTLKNGTQATPDVVATGLNSPWGIACDSSGAFVYFTQNTVPGQLLRAKKDGSTGVPDVLATGLTNPTYVRKNEAGDGLLYLCENGVAPTGRVLRFDTSTATQPIDAAHTLVSDNGNSPPAFNIRLFTVSGTVQAFITYMPQDATGGPTGQLRVKSTTALSGDITTTTRIATGLLPPTDLTVDAAGSRVYWTEFDAQNGGVRFAALNAVDARGTSIGTGDAFTPPYGIVGTFTGGGGTILVTRNVTEGSGGGLYKIDVATGISTLFTSPGANFPLNFTTDSAAAYVTEFPFPGGSGQARVLKFGF